MVKFTTDDVEFSDIEGRTIGRVSQGDTSYPLDYRYNREVQKVPSFYPPEGMVNARGPSDPDSDVGSDIRDIQDEGLELYLAKEVEEFGDGLYLESSARRALGKFVQTPSYSRDGVFQRGETRWGYRPPIINHMAGGEDSSYHMKGRAVDLTLTSSTVNLLKLMDVVVNAINSGFRCIGFGGVQFHLDTRDVGGFMGYTYPTWNRTFPQGAAEQLGIPIANVYEGQLLTPTLVFKIYLLYYSAKRPDILNVNRPMTVREVESIVRDRTIPSVSDSDNVRYFHISNSDCNRWAVPIRATQQVITSRATEPEEDTSRPLTGTRATREPSSTPSEPGQLPYLFRKEGRTDLINLGILSAVILGGYFGFRAFLRHIRNRSEKARVEKEIRRLYSTKSRRELIGEFRMKNAGAIVRAKRDPRLARELEMKLARILANNGYPVY